jgi:excisionase family DNA binding protein
VDKRLAYRPNEAATLLGVSRDIIFKALAAGELRGSFRAGRARLIPVKSLQDWMARLASEQSPS